MRKDFTNTPRIFEIKQSIDFESLCLEIFSFQFSYSPIYRRFCQLIGITRVSAIRNVSQIPFLPVEFFRTQAIIAEHHQPAMVFKSSGTTGSLQSSHLVSNLSIYDESLLKGFELHYGDPANYCILALLPFYIERKESSLVYMTRKLMQHSGHPNNGFYLYDYDALARAIDGLIYAKQPTILLGVSFALLDFSHNYPIPLPENFIVMETGGMKGRGKEMVREELHQILCKRFSINSVHSEYGMTEMLSQAYAKKHGIYHSPPWLRVQIRDVNDPFQLSGYNKTGGINIIDLANVYSCPFIETQDLGRKYENGTFEVVGRFDRSKTRGCNLMIP